MTFDLSVIDFFAGFARDGMNGVGPFLSRYTILRFRKNIPQCQKKVLGQLFLASQNSFYVFGNSTNVRDNLKTSSRYLAHRSVTQRRNWFATVKKESFLVAVVLKGELKAKK